MLLPEWRPRPTPGERTLIGRCARLEPLDWRVQGAGLFDAVGGEHAAHLWRYIPSGPFPAAGDLRGFFEHARTEENWRPLAILSASDDRVLGSASFMRIREAHGSAEVGCVVFGAELKRSTIATEAIALMAAHLFDELGYRRFEWKCNNANLASRRAAERLGFRFEGVFRNDMVVKGESRDTAWYAMTDTDWPAIRSAFEAWLHPGNFDAHGRQKERLASLRPEPRT
ncbi:GNAT family N-acetyltransferase [bacterium]|nr:GNAT family N-acetyltransferase [bacterium]